jgi:hypothetical protein
VTNLYFDEWVEWVLRDPLVSHDGRCAEQGIERLATGNDSTNTGMLAINNALGYRPWIIWHDYVLRP